VKNDGSNLNAMTIVLKFVVNCEILGLDESFRSFYFGHVFSKACQYAITNKKIYRNFKFVLIKFA
jgi:hypothetical protein